MSDASQEAWALVPAAGIGQRFSNRSDKLVVHIGGLPMIVRTVETLLNAKSITGAVVVVHPEKKMLYQRMLHEYGHRKPVHFVNGGASRRESVFLGLQAIPDTASIVAIHDAARPLVNPDLVDTAIEKVRQGAIGVVVAVPIYDTVKMTHVHRRFVIERTLDRSCLWRAQTPQVFLKEKILDAHQSVTPELTVTDDAQLMELAKIGPVEVLEGEERNLKITTEQDLVTAEALFRSHR